ncbi:hypothetical protein F2P56_028337 [Juglans regia]|uniref:Protein FAR1-RELATED SEQUENCE n=1 Tax=Juglans regia TaxID=51240 RepID=A0A833UJP7_JUGRE|nr:hypothetical protein F2P56_028337 [Juglans regia]
MRLQNDGFVYVIDVDEELRLRNVFWADARSRAAYEYFGDVITFDTTYLTNRYGMPFAPFVGVNHHGQSILLGAALISSEDTSTFVWLFQAWLECMDGRAPKAIITDQDRAMKAAIALKLGSHAAFNAGLKTAIQSALYDSQTCDEFEEKWGQLIQKYGLGENQWLQGLYNKRSFWVPVYLKGVFWAGMSTTQRSESMNAFFDGFVHSGTMLKEFVDQFDNALRKKVEVETTADFNSSNQTIPCSSAFRIEKQFQAVYTNAKFKEVQREVWGMILCNCILISKEGCISTYDVLDEITTDDDHVKSIKYTVYFNDEEIDLKCTCALFEMRGIVCRHALNVCQMNKIHALPEKYLLERWRKDLKRRYTVVKSSYDDLRQNADSRRCDSTSMLVPFIHGGQSNHVGLLVTFIDVVDRAAGPLKEFKALPMGRGVAVTTLTFVKKTQYIMSLKDSNYYGCVMDKDVIEKNLECGVESRLAIPMMPTFRCDSDDVTYCAMIDADGLAMHATLMYIVATGINRPIALVEANVVQSQI